MRLLIVLAAAFFAAAPPAGTGPLMLYAELDTLDPAQAAALVEGATQELRGAPGGDAVLEAELEAAVAKAKADKAPLEPRVQQAMGCPLRLVLRADPMPGGVMLSLKAMDVRGTILVAGENGHVKAPTHDSLVAEARRRVRAVLGKVPPELFVRQAPSDPYPAEEVLQVAIAAEVAGGGPWKPSWLEEQASDVVKATKGFAPAGKSGQAERRLAIFAALSKSDVTLRVELSDRGSAKRLDEQSATVLQADLEKTLKRLVSDALQSRWARHRIAR